MSVHGDSDADATEEINVDDSDSGSCSPRNYANDNRRLPQEHSECSNSPPPSQTSSRTLQNESPRSHPFSISRLLGENRSQNPKSPSSEDLDSDKERKWSWEEGNNNGGLSMTLDDGRRSWGHEIEEKLSEKDDDDTGSTPETQTNSASSIHCPTAADLLAPFRLFPTGTGLIYTGGGVIRVPAHRPPGANGATTGALPAQALIPPWSLQALQHSQQQAAAAGLHRASLLANLAAHPLQGHPHLKDRLAGKRINVASKSIYESQAPRWDYGRSSRSATGVLERNPESYATFFAAPFARLRTGLSLEGEKETIYSETINVHGV